MKFLLAGCIISLLLSCVGQPDCLITATNQVKIALKKTTSEEANSVLFTSITISGTDSTFQDKKNAKVSSLILYVNPHDVETTFKFKYLDASNVEKSDFLVVSYLAQNVVISPECGGYVYYSNLYVLATSFLITPKIVNSQLSTSATVNIEIKL